MAVVALTGVLVYMGQASGYAGGNRLTGCRHQTNLTGRNGRYQGIAKRREEQITTYPIFYRTAQIDGLSIFYRKAGPKDAPTGGMKPC